LGLAGDGLQKNKGLLSELGEVRKTSPLRDPAKGDFRPAQGVAGVDKGVKVFVPWSLCGVVGTTIEELNAWEFDGPQMRDFNGRKPTGARSVGAIAVAP
jgi:hypothetical protein